MQTVLKNHGMSPIRVQRLHDVMRRHVDAGAVVASDVIYALREKNYLAEDATEIDRPECLDKCLPGAIQTRSFAMSKSTVKS